MAGRPRYPAGPAVGVRRKEPPWKGPWGPDALGPAPQAELPHVLMLPDFDWADAIGSYWGNPATRTFAELLIDCEEDRTLRAVLLGMLREMHS
jgi:hypothetical protein